jgi:hypothetical protein
MLKVEFWVLNGKRQGVGASGRAPTPPSKWVRWEFAKKGVDVVDNMRY